MEDTPLVHTALNNVSLTVEEGAFTAIAGETGAGKSTLMQLIGGLLVPRSGSVKVDGISLHGTTAQERKAARETRFRGDHRCGYCIRSAQSRADRGSSKKACP